MILKKKNALLEAEKNTNYFDLNSYFIQSADYDDYLNMYGINNTMISEVVDAIENDKLDYLANLNDADFCGHCLIKKAPKTRHCPNTNLCVPKQHFYSKLFDKPVYFANELIYLGILLCQVYLLFSYLTMFSDQLYGELRENHVYVHPPYILFQLTNTGRYLDMIVYMTVFYLFGYNLWQLIIFKYGIIRNITQDELFNPQYYSYLFNLKAVTQNEYMKNRKEAVERINPNDRGYKNNIKLFLKQALVNQLIIR